MADIKEVTDAELERFALVVRDEQERRRALKAIPDQMDAMNAAYLAANGVVQGGPWSQPVAAFDAYPEGWEVEHAGKVWVSLTPANVWEPSVSGWREVAGESTGPPEWVAPTGAHDAYRKGDKVTFQGVAYASVLDGNTWSPADYPAGWTVF